MEYLYENVEHSGRLPINIFTHSISNFPYHWHEDMEILFVLKGSVELTVDNKKTIYREGNVFGINSNDLHSLVSTSEDNITTILALQFNLNHFKEYNISSNTRFRIEYEKKGSAKRNAYNRLRLILATMMRAVINQEEPQQIIIERHLLDLLIVLINNFISPDKIDDNNQSDQERIIQIIKHISINCKDRDINLENIAEEFHLNPQYLSRYFKNNVGISFKKFLDNMRLNKSLETLKYTDDRVIDIALANGFADSKSYYRVFKDTLGITPTEYREKNKVETVTNRPKDYFSINKKETLSKLFEYLKYDNVLNKRIKNIDIKKHINLNGTGRDYKSSALKLITFGYAPHGLRQDFGRQLKMLQNDIGFEFIRFHGIFADEFLSYNENSEGEVYYNFNHIDELIDRLLENNIRPFIELGFMPKELASTHKKIFALEIYVSPPKDIEKWLDYVEAFFRHLINRYGFNEILAWYFEFWNEPEMDGAFFDGDVNIFYNFFKQTYYRIKSVNENIKVGGFGNAFFAIAVNWIECIAENAKKDGLKLDFISFHIYQSEMGDNFDSNKIKNLMDSPYAIQPYKGVDHSAFDAYLRSPEQIAQSIDFYIELIESLHINNGDYFITEFNASTDSRDLVHDTCYNAAYIVKSVLENSEKVSGIGYWTFTDIFEEFRLPQPLFHGGFGLITYNGIKKASYNAYKFLSKLGNTLLNKSDDMIVTKNGEDYQILLHNYCHYNQLYSRFDYSQISQLNRYEVFQNQVKKNILLKLSGVKGDYSVEIYRSNRKQGSSYDAWVNMGAPKQISKGAYECLQAASIPTYEYIEQHIEGDYEIDIELEPHEIQLIILTKQY